MLEGGSGSQDPHRQAAPAKDPITGVANLPPCRREVGLRHREGEGEDADSPLQCEAEVEKQGGKRGWEKTKEKQDKEGYLVWPSASPYKGKKGNRAGQRGLSQPGPRQTLWQVLGAVRSIRVALSWG